MTAKKYTRQDLSNAAEKYKNWGKWGPNDEIGTLNYTTAEDIVAAAQLVRKAKAISLALNFDKRGPEGGNKYTRQALSNSAEKYKNWGKWGPNDEIGTLNYTTAEDI